MESNSWYRSWFNTHYYHILYKNRDNVEAAAFIDRVLKYLLPASDSKFLDLACGKGRHSVYINKKGFDVTGVDLSPESIRKANESTNEHLRFEEHDMRVPYTNAKFDYIVNLFTSFGYFESIEENREVLTAANSALKDKGILLIDFMNVNQVLEGLVKAETQEIEGVKFTITRQLVDGVIEKKIHIEDGDKEFDYYERVKALTRQDFIGMMGQSGFEILDTFGNYNLDAFDASESSRLILIARKTG